MAVECGVVKKSGSWYTYGEERLGQGREAGQRLAQNPDLRNEIEYKVREAYDIPQPGAVAPADQATSADAAKNAGGATGKGQGEERGQSVAFQDRGCGLRQGFRPRVA